MKNLNEDPLLNGKVIYPLTKKVTNVGRDTGDSQPDIILKGLGIKPNHAMFVNENNQITIEPGDQECCEFIFLNGETLTTKTVLKDNDRLIFGTASSFLVVFPGENHNVKDEHDWEYA